MQIFRSNFAIENQYFGSSLQSLINLAEKKGYVFLGTPSTGVNCFFIKNDFSNYVLENLKEINIIKLHIMIILTPVDKLIN